MNRQYIYVSYKQNLIKRQFGDFKEGIINRYNVKSFHISPYVISQRHEIRSILISFWRVFHADGAACSVPSSAGALGTENRRTQAIVALASKVI